MFYCKNFAKLEVLAFVFLSMLRIDDDTFIIFFI